MTSSTRQFRAQAVPTIIMVFLTPLFCGLGIWQLDRAEQKRSLGSSLEMRRKLPALSLNTMLPDKGRLEFRHVEAMGNFLSDKTILIENRKHLGKTGYHVVTPIQLSENGGILLVNRGWIPRERIDNDATLPTPVDTVTIRGQITIPQAPAIELGRTASAVEGTPRWPYLTLDSFTAWSGLEILPFAILQSPDDSHGFVRRWPHPRVSDMMHIGYAIQWFAFALITLLVWLRLSMQTPPENGEKQ
ncbi:MAG: SURF1 family protein [Candidatus Thiodiazotropha sp. (ex Dulcina madagascariensis)]|nr:SURF1 family protein [Candidatus Thiodiazotropha sp. (ex Dulcina madagascariensis)]MCU7927577.1 SURF1 family protein [Candidatus Thiodiazotropha sp. (ex Dulcina madagascariensis)]